MRRSRLKILPARCLTFLGFILVMLVCPTIAEVNVGIGDVYEPGHSDSELQHPAAKFLRNGFEVCQMKDGPGGKDVPLDLPPDSSIGSSEEAVISTRKSDPEPLHEKISRRGERFQSCYDSRRNVDSMMMRRNAVKIQHNSRLANREGSEVRMRNSRNVVSSRTERSSPVELPEKAVEVANEARRRVTSERRNDMARNQIRSSPVRKEERLNREELSYRRRDERRSFRTRTASDSSRNVDARRTSDERRGDSSERLSRVRIGTENSNMNERRDVLRQSNIERENTVHRLTRRSSSLTRNQARLSPETARKSENERSIVEEERRHKSRGLSSDERRRSDTQRRQTESERRESTRRTVRMATAAELDPTGRRMTSSTERQRENRDVHLNANRQSDNRRQQRESRREDRRAVRMTRSLERRSMVDTERQERFSDISSDSQRRDRVTERRDSAHRSVRMVRSVDSIPAEMRSTVENERHQKTRESTVRATRQNENRRLDRVSERREPTHASLRRTSSSEAIAVERRSIVDDKRQSRISGRISNTQTDGRRQDRTSERRDSALPSIRLVRSVRSIPTDSSTTSVDSERRQRISAKSLNSRRHERDSERREAIRLAVRIIRSVETEPEERETFRNSERHQRTRGSPLNTIRQTDSRGKQRESERRDLPQRIARTESTLSPLSSERRRRTDDVASNIRRLVREPEMRDTARRSSRMVRSTESLERRSILDSERNRENRDSTIRQVRSRSQRRESERRDLVRNSLSMARLSERRSVIDAETQERFRDISLNSRRQQRESQRRDTARQSIRASRSIEPLLNEIRTTEDSERRQTTRDARMNVRRQGRELEGREPVRRSVRMARSTESLPQERRSFVDTERMERSREVTSNPIRHTDNRRQQRESERRDLARRIVREFRSLESSPAGRRSSVDFERQERFRDTTLSVRRQNKELRDTDRRSIRTARSLESLATERRSNSERQQGNLDALMTRSLERRSVVDLERKEILPYFTSRSRRQERESERRYSARRAVGVVRSLESNLNERRSILNSERQQRTQNAIVNTRRQDMELERRNPELRSVRRVRSAEPNPSERSATDNRRQERTEAISQRRQVESERRDLARRIVRVARSLRTIPSERVSPADNERRQINRDLSLHTSRKTNNVREQRESEIRDITRRVNRMVSLVEAIDRTSERVSERQQRTRDATSSFRRHESQSERRNLARNSRTSEQREDRQRREMVHRLSLEKDARTTRATSREDRLDYSLAQKSRRNSPYVNFLDASSRSRRVKESRISSFIPVAEESNDRLVSRTANRERSSLENSVPLSMEARSTDRRTNSNFRTIQDRRLSQTREIRIDSRSRNGRVLSTDRAIAAGIRNQISSSTRRFNHNVPSAVSVRMERIIGNKEGRFDAVLAETRKREDRAPLSERFYLTESQITPDTHLNARKVIVISKDRFQESDRRNAIRNAHLVRDTMSRSANWRRKVNSERESDITRRNSRDSARDSVLRQSKLGSFVLTERRQNFAESKPLTRRTTALGREVYTLQSDTRASKETRRSQLLNGRVNEKYESKSFRDLNGLKKGIHGHIPITDSHDADESYDVILSNDQGNELLMQLSRNGSSPFTHIHEMDHPGKIVHNPIPFEEEGYDHKIGYGLNQENLFSLTIGGSVAAFLISTSLK